MDASIIFFGTTIIFEQAESMKNMLKEHSYIEYLRLDIYIIIIVHFLFLQKEAVLAYWKFLMILIVAVKSRCTL
jgi:hypothetical protein